METTALDTLRSLNKKIAIMTGFILFACVAIVLADIVMRRFGASFGGTDEISGYVMAIVTSWGMGFTLLELGHVRIDIIRGRCVGLRRAVFDIFSLTVLAGTITLIAVKSWPVLARSLHNGSQSNTPLETPLAWVQTPWLAGWVWFALMAWLTLVAALVLVAKGDFDRADTVIGAQSEQEAAS